MPEGDTIFRAAATLHRALACDVVTRFESVFPALTRVADDSPIVGRTIESVSSKGKHLLVRFSGDLVLHTHMRMNGSWHLYPAGTRWRRPAREMRIVISTARADAVGFNIPIAEFLTSRTLARHRDLATLGSDLLAADFDRASVLAAIRVRPRDTIADLLLNQHVVAGIGNVLKAEILFVARVYPFTAAQDLDDDTMNAIVDVSLDLLRRNVADRSRTLAPTRGRRTTASLHPAKGLWVYGRAGQPCRRCGAPIVSRKTGSDARLTFWCAHCQPPRD